MIVRINSLLIVVIKNILIIIIYFFSGFVKKNKNTWCLGSWRGQIFRGNIKFLYDYIKENQKDIEVFWFSKSKKLYEKLKKEGIDCVYVYSYSGIYKILTSKFIFLSHGIVDINPCLVRNSTLIKVGHITFSIKETSLKRILEKKNFFEKIEIFLHNFPNYIIKTNYQIFSSKYSHENLKISDISFPKKHLILGLPKTDFLLKIKKDKIKFNKKENNFLNTLVEGSEKKILFLPTSRSYKNFSIFDYGFSEDKISNFIDKKKCNFLINFHPDFFINKHEYYNDIKNFNILNVESDDLYKLFALADILITDYSSLFADFLIFDKPIIFTKFDYINFESVAKPKVNYFDLPGPKVDNWDELLDAIDQTLFNKDDFEYKRLIWKKNIYKKLDDNNSKRIVDYFKSDPLFS